MKKLLFTFILALIAVQQVAAHDFEVDNLYYTIRDASAKTVAVTGVRTAYGNVVIPESVTYSRIKYKVVEIGEKAFYPGYGATKYMTGVEIPNTVTDIGNGAFQDCSGLLNVVIPNSVTTIGDRSFSGCSEIKKVTVGTGLRFVGTFAFSNCQPDTVNITDLESWCRIDFAENKYGASVPGYYTIDSNPLRGASLYLNGHIVEDLVIPNTITTVNSHAFFHCQSIKSVTIPASVTSIGEYAFSGCWNVTAFTFSDNLISVGRGAFSDTQWLRSQPYGIVYAGRVAYTYMGSAVSIEIKEGTIAIADAAFRDYSGENVVIPNTVKHIGKSAFSSCWQLKSITIPNSVETIGEYAFSGCFNATSLVISNSVTELPIEAFSGCRNLTSISIPESVTSIGNSCFFGCDKLVNITFPDSICYIGDYAFSNTPWLYSLPNGMNYVGLVAFRYCGTMPAQDRDIVIKDGTVQVAGDAFPNYSLKSVVLPSSIKYVGQSSFIDCDNLNSITCYAIEPPQTLEEVNYKPFNNPGFLNATVYVHKQSQADYKSDPWWRYFKNIVSIEGTGDVNGDGAVNISDISITVDAILSGEYDENFDLNGDGMVNISDINMLIGIILKS